MFKYKPEKPNSLFSVLIAGVRLYFASFIYTLALSIAIGLTALMVSWYFQLVHFNLILVSLYSSIITTFFIIPLVKRIYGVGAGLPISFTNAYRGIFTDYVRMVTLLCIYMFIYISTNVFELASEYNTLVWALTVGSMVVIDMYIIFRVYFANLFIILENKHTHAAIEASTAIEAGHMWLSFGVVVLFIIAYQILERVIAPYIPFTLLGHKWVNLLAVIIGTPLFFSIQMVQFFNLKNLINGH